MSFSNNTLPPGSIKRITHNQGGLVEISNKDVAVVVISIGKEFRFDDMFLVKPQRYPQGKVAVFSVQPGRILEYVEKAIRRDESRVKELRLYVDPLHNSRTRNTLEELMLLLDQIRNENLWVNFESCSEFDCGTFGEHENFITSYKRIICYVVKQHAGLCIFSNLSLFALIKTWEKDEFLSEQLGPLPFTEMGLFTGQLKLTFNPKKLLKSDIFQLQSLTKLCNKKVPVDHLIINTQGETVLFSINREASHMLKRTSKQTKTRKYYENRIKRGQITKAEMAVYDYHIAGNFTHGEAYNLAVLTSAVFFGNSEKTDSVFNFVAKSDTARFCSLGKEKGLAGHVLLTYPPPSYMLSSDVKPHELPRGRILASNAHWIEIQSSLVSNTTETTLEEEDF